MLQDREKTILTLQALDQVMQGMQAHQRMQWPAMMARGEVRGPGHSQRRSGEHGANRHTSPELRQRVVDDLTWGGFLDKLHQGFDLIRKLHSFIH